VGLGVELDPSIINRHSCQHIPEWTAVCSQRQKRVEHWGHDLTLSYVTGLYRVMHVSNHDRGQLVAVAQVDINQQVESHLGRTELLCRRRVQSCRDLDHVGTCEACIEGLDNHLIVQRVERADPSGNRGAAVGEDVVRGDEGGLASVV